jgi:hypothetical protein
VREGAGHGAWGGLASRSLLGVDILPVGEIPPLTRPLRAADVGTEIGFAAAGGWPVTPRAVLRFVAWTIAPHQEPDAKPIIHAMQCAACGEKSLPFEDIEPARLWALQHAGRTRHDDYREGITRPWRALPAEGASL